MSIMPYDLSFFFKNIQKSHAAAAAYLYCFLYGPYDFLFFQELQGKTYHWVTDINSPEGMEVFGLPINPAWTCLPMPAHNSQVAIFVHVCISVQCFFFF